VTDLAKAGHVVATGKNRYDVAASVPKYYAHLRSLSVGRGGEAAQATAARERARLASAMADKAELGNARQRGVLLDADALSANGPAS
jgi:phage terminase Nu1 subunit (DNA packaging protein)